MTVAAQEAAALDACLKQGSDDLAQRFFKAAARVVDVPWDIAVGNDLRHPAVQGPRPAMVRFINWYIGKLHLAAQQDEILTNAFLARREFVAAAADAAEPGRGVARAKRKSSGWRLPKRHCEERSDAAIQPARVSSPENAIIFGKCGVCFFSARLSSPLPPARAASGGEGSGVGGDARRECASYSDVFACCRETQQTLHFAEPQSPHPRPLPATRKCAWVGGEFTTHSPRCSPSAPAARC